MLHQIALAEVALMLLLGELPLQFGCHPEQLQRMVDLQKGPGGPPQKGAGSASVLQQLVLPEGLWQEILVQLPKMHEVMASTDPHSVVVEDNA